LQYRLRHLGFATEWIHSHAELRCPRCHSRLRYGTPGNGRVVGRCVSRCTETSDNRLPELRATIAELYTNAFDDRVTSEQILRFDV
jgi:hypothetical protein